MYPITDIKVDNNIYFCKPYEDVQQAPQTDYEVPMEPSQAPPTDYEIPVEILQNSQNSWLSHSPQLENVYEAMSVVDKVLDSSVVTSICACDYDYVFIFRDKTNQIKDFQKSTVR